MTKKRKGAASVASPRYFGVGARGRARDDEERQKDYGMVRTF